MDKRLVVFTQSNARVINNPDQAQLSDLAHWPNVVIDPDLSQVEGVPPHFWKLENGVIVPMTILEREARLKQIDKTGVINKVERRLPVIPKPPALELHQIDWIAYGLIFGALVYLIFK